MNKERRSPVRRRGDLEIAYFAFFESKTIHRGIVIKESYFT